MKFWILDFGFWIFSPSSTIPLHILLLHPLHLLHSTPKCNKLHDYMHSSPSPPSSPSSLSHSPNPPDVTCHVSTSSPSPHPPHPPILSSPASPAPPPSLLSASKTFPLLNLLGRIETFLKVVGENFTHLLGRPIASWPDLPWSH